jgi:hypothetical protein
MSDDSPADDPRRRFLDLLAQAVHAGAPLKLVLSKYHGEEADLQRVQARSLVIRGEACLSFVYRYRSRDLTANLPLPQALQRVDELLASGFRQANLQASGIDAQLGISKRGKALFRTGAAATDTAAAVAEPDPHNREKRRLLSLERPFLQALGVTDGERRLIPSMARKWKQINRFIEVFDDAWRSSGLQQRQAPLRLIDFGSGKGYLTFALHDYLRNTLGVAAHTRGVELRRDLVATCNAACAAAGIDGLAFIQGDIASYPANAAEAEGAATVGMAASEATETTRATAAQLAPACDVMIALHACDTATDDAIHQGIRAGAAIIMCAPCCHKQVRPQLLSPHPLRPILQHGIHLGQEAEMLTDGLRALLMDASGYDTQVFEFISLEHTGKNKMILGVKRAAPRPAGPVLAQIRDIKAFYGIREQRLESLLAPELSDSHH